jgi:methyl-accepting chemotaxis protein
MILFSRMTIRGRLAAAFALVLLISLGAGVAAIWQMRAIAAASADVLKVPLTKERLISDWTRNTAVSLRRATAVARSSDPSLADFFADENAQTSKDNAALLKQLEALPATPAEKAILAKLDEHRNKFRTLRDGISKAKKEGRADEARNLLDNGLVPHARTYMVDLQLFLDTQRKSIDEAAVAIEAAASRGRQTVIGLLVLAVALGALLAWHITRGISAPLEDTVRALERVADGDLSVRLAVAPEARNEIDRLQNATTRMVDGIASLVAEIRHQTDELTGAADALARASTGVRAGGEEQSAAATAMAAALEEMSTSVNHVSTLSADARRLSQQSGNVAGQGAQAMQAMIDEVDQIAATIQEAATTANRLGSDSAQISNITSAIKDVANQTNLLALNAAIEAARAGEQGRGFAVVADEVRKLAEQASRSAEEIATTIASIQAGVDDMTNRMDRSVERVQNGIRCARSAGELMSTIRTETDQAVTVSGEVATALDEQASASQDIAERVEAIVQMIERNNASTESVAGTAERLNDLAARLKQDVAAFRLAEIG